MLQVVDNVEVMDEFVCCFSRVTQLPEQCHRCMQAARRAGEDQPNFRVLQLCDVALHLHR